MEEAFKKFFALAAKHDEELRRMEAGYCTCMTMIYPNKESRHALGLSTLTIRDPWCPVHKEYLFEYESKGE